MCNYIINKVDIIIYKYNKLIYNCHAIDIQVILFIATSLQINQIEFIINRNIFIHNSFIK